METIAAHGLRIDGLWGDHTVTGFSLATAPTALEGPFDLVVVSVKSYDTLPMAQAAGRLLAAGGTMLSLQNGLGNVEIIAQQVGETRVLAGRVIFGAESVAPGHVRVTVYADPVLIGAWPAVHDSALAAQARRWADALDAAGVPAQYTDDIIAALWGKVFYNAALNPLGALLGVHYGALGAHPDTRAIMDAAIDEAFAVAVAEGVALPWSTAAEYRAVFYGRLLPSTFDHRSSMLQDLERGRRTEIDAINGAVWQRAAARGTVTPVNEMLTRLVRARAETERGAHP